MTNGTPRQRFEIGGHVVYAKDYISAKTALRKHQAKLTQGTTGISIAQDLTRQTREAQGVAKAKEISRMVKVDRYLKAKKEMELARRRKSLKGRVGLYAEKKWHELPGLMLQARRKAVERAPAVKARAKVEAKAFARGGLIVGKKVVKSRAVKGLWRYLITEGGTKSKRRLKQ